MADDTKQIKLHPREFLLAEFIKHTPIPKFVCLEDKVDLERKLRARMLTIADTFKEWVDMMRNDGSIPEWKTPKEQRFEDLSIERVYSIMKRKRKELQWPAFFSAWTEYVDIVTYDQHASDWVERNRLGSHPSASSVGKFQTVDQWLSGVTFANVASNPIWNQVRGSQKFQFHAPILRMVNPKTVEYYLSEEVSKEQTRRMQQMLNQYFGSVLDCSVYTFLISNTRMFVEDPPVLSEKADIQEYENKHKQSVVAFRWELPDAKDPVWSYSADASTVYRSLAMEAKYYSQHRAHSKAWTATVIQQLKSSIESKASGIEYFVKLKAQTLSKWKHHLHGMVVHRLKKIERERTRAFVVRVFDCIERIHNWYVENNEVNPWKEWIPSTLMADVEEAYDWALSTRTQSTRTSVEELNGSAANEASMKETEKKLWKESVEYQMRIFQWNHLMHMLQRVINCDEYAMDPPNMDHAYQEASSVSKFGHKCVEQAEDVEAEYYMQSEAEREWNSRVVSVIQKWNRYFKEFVPSELLPQAKLRYDMSRTNGVEYLLADTPNTSISPQTNVAFRQWFDEHVFRMRSRLVIGRPLVVMDGYDLDAIVKELTPSKFHSVESMRIPYTQWIRSVALAISAIYVSDLSSKIPHSVLGSSLAAMNSFLSKIDPKRYRLEIRSSAAVSSPASKPADAAAASASSAAHMQD